MIDKDVVEKTLIERIDELEVGHCIDMRTYKRNRSVLFVKLSEDGVLVLENGFEEGEFRVRKEALPKLLRKILKREFPRSRKVRLYALGEYDPEKLAAMQRKVI